MVAGTSGRVSIRRVAAAAGVSMSTVSNVLNKPHLVADDTRRRVEHVMDQMGFVRNGAARQLRGVTSPVVGCVLLDVSNTFYAEVVHGIEGRLAEEDCILALCSSDLREGREAHFLRMLEEQGVRGILVSPVSRRLDRLEQLRERGMPVVLLDHPRDDWSGCAVAVDHVEGGRLAAEHLIRLGHRQIVSLAGRSGIPAITQRTEGVRTAVTAGGLDPDRHLVEIPVAAGQLANAGEEAVDRILALDPRPTAIICVNDMAALGAIRGLRKHGLSVPDDMSVVGYDDVLYAEALSPSLTTLRRPRCELGKAAVNLLLDEGSSGHRHEELLYQPTLVVRESTGRPPLR